MYSNADRKLSRPMATSSSKQELTILSDCMKVLRSLEEVDHAFSKDIDTHRRELSFWIRSSFKGSQV